MFYRAIVENNVDPEKFGRVQVRVFGIHDEGSGVSTADLPWAEVSGGTDFGLIDGVGITSVLRIGTMVWIFFNNDDYNYPVVFATIKGSSDINDVAKGSYTNVATLKTASGHIIELGDTIGAEKIKITHRTGTYIEIKPDGSIFMDTVADMESTVAGNFKLKVTGTTDIESSGNFSVKAPRIDLN